MKTKTNNKLMAKTTLKSYTLADMKDKYIGKEGTSQRDQYEYELRMDVLVFKRLKFLNLKAAQIVQLSTLF